MSTSSSHLQPTSLKAAQPKGPATQEKVEPKKHTSRWDAFATQNRLKISPGANESPQDYAFGIKSRLANQEARQLIRRPVGFSEQAYEGFKLFFRVFGEQDQSVGNCVVCHVPSEFTDNQTHLIGTRKAIVTPTVRNLSATAPYGSVGQHQTLEDVIQEKMTIGNLARAAKLHPISEPMRRVLLNEKDIPRLAAFLRQLNDVDEERYRYFLIHFDN